MPDMTIEYAGGLKLVAHRRGHAVVTDQPESDGGENTAMTPTELFIASLATCAGFYVVTFAGRHDVPMEGMTIGVSYTYADRPRRIGSVDIRVKLPQPVDDHLRTSIQRAAEQCLVHNSLRQPPEVTIVAS